MTMKWAGPGRTPRSHQSTQPSALPGPQGSLSLLVLCDRLPLAVDPLALLAKEKHCLSTTPAGRRIVRLYFTACPLALIAYHFPPNCLVPTLEVSPGLVVAMSMYSGWPA